MVDSCALAPIDVRHLVFRIFIIEICHALPFDNIYKVVEYLSFPLVYLFLFIELYTLLWCCQFALRKKCLGDSRMEFWVLYGYSRNAITSEKFCISVGFQMVFSYSWNSRLKIFLNTSCANMSSNVPFFSLYWDVFIHGIQELLHFISWLTCPPPVVVALPASLDYRWTVCAHYHTYVQVTLKRCRSLHLILLQGD